MSKKTNVIDSKTSTKILKSLKLTQQEQWPQYNTANLDKNSIEAQKLSGPVNGNECYFWRTTGCLYADKCRYEHLKKSKGIDKKPWHK
jgi:hypothetical protein